ncbi:MAG: Antibiotic biosynthesis monooxygenase [Nocardioides sp.]|jgi:antibiotic biosynthesis monooxygenase (ABM) superfamily enzyme|nr:Antibiotic biosynthesis monooxygenase [Nocardioides sp.]
MSAPVTVSITRHLDPGREHEMVSWIQAGIALAERFPGFLGAGWVRPGADSETWHMLYRFHDTESLSSWESSHERQWWRDSAGGLGVVESRMERRTGIEGWFDDPTTRDLRDLRLAPAAPPRYKQAVVIWLAFFPLSLLVAWLFGQVAPGLPLVERALASTLLMTPVMTYVVLPRMTRALGWWLQGRPAPWRRASTA